MSGAPAMIRAWDPANTTIQNSDYLEALRDRHYLGRISGELIRLYEGNQLQYLLNYLASFITNEVLRARYEELATFTNVVRLLVDRVSTLGQLPVRIIWDNPKDQELWDEVAVNLAGDNDWDSFIAAVARRIELCKTVVASCTWDEEDRGLDLDFYTPNVIDVGYAEGNLRRRRPDIWMLLKEPATSLWQKWDFSPEHAGRPNAGQIYLSDQHGVALADDEPIPVPVIDPASKRGLVPFVAFRTDFATRDFFIWDGQSELLQTQQMVNRSWTQISVNLAWGSFRMAILSGGGWTDEEGNLAKLTFDQSVALQEPFDPLGADKGPKIRWDGPKVEEVIKVQLEVISEWIQQVAATFHINPSAIRAKNEATSGYALQIESAALRIKNARTRTLARRPIARLVEKARITWNHYNPPSRQFSALGSFQVVIPDYSSGVTTSDEVSADVLKRQNHFTTQERLVLKHNPDMSPLEAKKLADELEATALAGAGGDKVQDTALNGAQVVALKDIVAAVTAGQLPGPSATAMLLVSFPTLSAADAASIVDPAAAYATSRPALPAAAAPPAPPALPAPMPHPQPPAPRGSGQQPGASGAGRP